SNVVIYPDKKYYNVNKLTEDKGLNNNPNYTGFEENKIVEPMEVRYKSSGEVWVDLCNANGNAYAIDTKSSDEPKDNVKNGHIWLDTSVTPPSLKRYSEPTKMWVSITSTYIRISSAGLGKVFEVNDSVKISGIEDETVQNLNNSTVIVHAKGDNYIVFAGFRDSAERFIQTTPIKAERLVPHMDFVCESGNRIWGCRYGENINGDTVNEIYASKLGDFKNWEYFQGTATDSYMASVGADGEFTGAISYLGRPMFFKQNCLYTVYGNYPATYQIQLTECRGVQIGCHNSLVVIDGTLYYKALGGVCAYNGSLPVEVGSALGEQGKKYYEACAGEYRHKYYIGLTEKDDNDKEVSYLFVYDTEKNMWHKEDQYNGGEFCYCTSGDVDGLYYIANGRVETVIGQPWHDKLEENIDWFAETGILGTSSPDKKYISKISIRFSVDLGTRIRVFAEYDSSGAWEQLAVFTGTRLGAFTLPFKPRRCDHLRLRIEGNGAAKIYSISKTMEDGGEI
ncbi:MAG: hypothetical protein J6P97_05110, partial [Bacteroidales bacterium]|nr:hypothetical protein [Bacteroidales bacterium]